MDFRYECPHIAPSIGSPQSMGDPDLLFLREDLADELGAIVGYLECSKLIRERRISDRFRQTAGDEVGHFIQLIRMIAQLDPAQAVELKKQGLIVLNLFNEQSPSFGMTEMHKGSDTSEHQHREMYEKKVYPPDERVLECLRNAIRDELHAINAYQKQLQFTGNPNVQTLITTIMNKEKEHVAEFTRLFYDIYHE